MKPPFARLCLTSPIQNTLTTVTSQVPGLVNFMTGNGLTNLLTPWTDIKINGRK